MSSTVFISHAGADTGRAAEVAQSLTAAGIRVRFDRAELTLGDSFLRFMNQALTTSDYCLLLWSARAAGTPWVEAEWEAAFYRSVRDKRSFLVTGRLEELPVPALLGPRLCVDLFPTLEPGITSLVTAWRSDRTAEARTGKPVVPAGTDAPVRAQDRATVYVDSEQFRMTAPIAVDLEEPAGVLLDRVVSTFSLPRELSHDGLLGVRLAYQLLAADQPLSRATPPVQQGIESGRVLTLQTTMTPFSVAQPVSGQLGPSTFRGESPESHQFQELEEAALRQATKEYRTALTRAGLR